MTILFIVKLIHEKKVYEKQEKKIVSEKGLRGFAHHSLAITKKCELIE